MKRMIFATLLAVASLGASTQSQAADARAAVWTQTDSWTYLGGALNLQHCAQIAGAQGFALAAFGGYVWNGFQWTYVVNGCFGTGSQGGGSSGGVAEYDVYVKAGYDAYDCAGDLEWQFGRDVRVDVSTLRSQTLEVSSRSPILDQLCQVRCVQSAYRINPDRTTTGPTSCHNRN